MESKPVKPQGLGQIEPIVAQAQTEKVAELILDAQKTQSSASPTQTQSSIRQQIFQAAISSLEKELLRQIFTVKTAPEALSPKVQTYGNAAQPQTESPKSTQSDTSLESRLLNLLNSQLEVGESSTEIKLAVKILHALISAKKDESQNNPKDARLELLQLLEKINSEVKTPDSSFSETAAEIKLQQKFTPEMRATLLQSIVSRSNGEDLLLENFLTRRNEIITAKREILSVLEKLGQPIAQNNVIEATTPEDINKLISKYLELLLSQSAKNLQELEQTSNTDLRIIFSGLKTTQSSIDFGTAGKQNNLLPALLIGDLVEQIIGKNITPAEQGSAINPANDITSQLKGLLKAVLSKDNSSLSGSFTPPLNNLDYIENSAEDLSKIDSKIILEEFIKNISGNSSSSNEDNSLNDFSSKMLRNSQSTLVTLSKLQQSILASGNEASFATFDFSDLADLSLNSLNLAVEVRSPELFRASTQFLRSSLSSRDILSSVTTLLIPLLDLISQSLEDNNLIAKAELGNINEQLENIKNTAPKAASKRKESMLQLLDKSTKLLESLSLSNKDFAHSSIEQKFLETLGKDSLNRLNILAEKIAQPNIATLHLPAPLQHLSLDFNAQTQQNKVSNSEDDAKDNQNYPAGAERIECSLLLPNIGECGVAITIWEKQIHLSICNQNQKVLDTALPLISELEKRLNEMDFEMPRIELNCAAPKPVKPEWLLELLAK